MNYKILICTTLLLGCFFYGQNIIVKDFRKFTPLKGAIVKSYDGKQIAITNSLGNASLPKGLTDSISIVHDKYETAYVQTSNFCSTEPNIVYLKDKVFILQGVIATGTNWKNNPKKSPVYITSISEEEIHALNASTTADILDRTNEVYIQKSQLGGGSPLIRGFATNRLLITVDGVNMNNAIFRSGNIHNIITIDPFIVKNIEVIAGPSSVLYGSDAIGGVISFETKSVIPKPEFNFSGDTSMRYSSASQEKTGHIDLELAMAKWASLSSFSFSEFGDLKMGKYGPQEYLRKHYVKRIGNEDILMENEQPRVQKFTGYSQMSLMQKIAYHPKNHLSLNLSVSYTKTHKVPRYDRLLRYRDHNLHYSEWYYGPNEWLFSYLKMDLTKPNAFFDEFQSVLSHQYFTESRHDRVFNSSLRRNRYERVNVWAFENSFMKKLGDINILHYGADIKFNHINSTGNEENITTGEKNPSPSRYPDGSFWNQYGIYSKLETMLNPNLNIVSGLRYSYVHSQSEFNNDFYPFPFEDANISTGALNGQIGIYYKPAQDIALTTQFSTGFRAPNIDDIGKVFDSEPGHVVVPNPKLKPEYIYNIEASVYKTFGNRLFLSLLGYHSWLQNALVRKDFMINGESTMVYDGELSQIQAVQNAAKARVYGGLLQMELNIIKSIKFFGKYNYTHGSEVMQDGNTAPLRHAPPMFGNIGLSFKKGKLQSELNYKYNAAVKAKDMPPNEIEKDYLYALDDNGRPYAPAWQTLNLSAQYTLNDYITLNSRIENIFNKLYRPYSSGISAPGRNFVISIRTIF